MSAIFCDPVDIFAALTVAFTHAHTKELFKQSEFYFLFF